MPERITEYAEFCLLDPVRIGQGLAKATVMNVGVLLRGAPIIGGRNELQRLGSVINDNIVRLAHTREGRGELKKQALVGLNADTTRFYYCSDCTGKLTPTHCSGSCRRRYTAPSGIAFSTAQPILPLRVAVYMLEQGHRFGVLP